MITPSGVQVKFSEEVLAALVPFVQRGPDDTEAGGVLLGRVIADTGAVILDEATTPQPADRRTRFGFEMDGPSHVTLMDAAHARSKGTCGYRGVWHTHAEPLPLPSDVDWADWSRRLREDVTDDPALLFVIVGTRTIEVWEGLRATGAIAYAGGILTP